MARLSRCAKKHLVLHRIWPRQALRCYLLSSTENCSTTTIATFHEFRLWLPAPLKYLKPPGTSWSMLIHPLSVASPWTMERQHLCWGSPSSTGTTQTFTPSKITLVPATMRPEYSRSKTSQGISEGIVREVSQDFLLARHYGQRYMGMISSL